ncbi:replication regulatory protein RepA [Salmonella enterica]|nr:replication regulatory protein RepA [Salmonella enterica]EBG9004545.1 replication regulatory protein RepA [Salmonella enterica]EBH0505137.1 replication regulatory protein RepA [Salmonella enterica]EBH0559229.1 replication regulatory protein RepA [Salmonella enterica]EBL7756228.1 replication regulatory protein RepA [Salmonella enterica]
MSQPGNAVTSSSKEKRQYRKGSPVPARERQQASLARRSSMHKAFHAVILSSLKEKLAQFAEEEGIPRAQMIEKLIELEAERRDSES